MFSAGTTSKRRRLNPPSSNDNFSGWEVILGPLIQAGSTVYSVGKTEDIAQAKAQAQASISAMQEETKRMELALKEKQLELLSQTSESNKLMSAAGIDLSSPTTLAVLGGAGLGLGLLTYLIFKK